MRSWLGSLALLGGLPVMAWGQADTLPEFRPLLRRLGHERAEYAFSDSLPAFQLPVVYRDSMYGDGQRRQLNFELQLTSKPLGLQRRVVRISSHDYPVSYSVLFGNCLVALFKNGKFGCYRLPDLVRDEGLERQLNAKSWERCWLLGGKLVAQKNKGYYAYDLATHAWQPYAQPVPFGWRPKLYEDARYLAYSDCRGEFGGRVYFYNKQTGRTHQVNATCAASIWPENKQYRLLASLNHMIGSARSAVIADPEKLALTSDKEAKKADWQYPGLTRLEQGATHMFNFYGLLLLSGFRWQNQTLYLMQWGNTTCVVTIDGRRITIVDPLFADGLYADKPVTTTYGPDLILTNLNGNSVFETSEVAALLWQGQQLTKVEWGW